MADIHGNYPALRACIDDAYQMNVQQYIFLGDYLGDLPYVRETMDFLYALSDNYNCIFVKGNKEEYWREYTDLWKCGSSTTGTMWFIHQRMTGEDMRFFDSLPTSRRMTYDHLPPITACHGTPKEIGSINDCYDIYKKKIINHYEDDLILFGHTHLRDIIRDGKRVAVNPGAVGYPQQSEGKSQYLILSEDSGTWKWEFRDVGYDIESVVQEIYDSGLYDAAPGWARIMAIVLRTGKISHRQALDYIKELCMEHDETYKWPDILEKYWMMAAEYFESKYCT